jgi:hypothetical protein
MSVSAKPAAAHYAYVGDNPIGEWDPLGFCGNQPPRSNPPACPPELNKAAGLDKFATNTQRAAGGAAVASLIPQAFGGPINPVADVFTVGGEIVAGGLEVASLAASVASGIIHPSYGNPGPLVVTSMTEGLSAASGLQGPASHIANTALGELRATVNQGPCN